MQAGYPPINVKYAERKDYYDCFKTFHNDKNIDAFVFLVTKYIEEELERYPSILK